MKYYQSDKLQKYINWDELMLMSRYAGGHDCQMTGLFKDAVVIGHYNSGDYQGSVATCVFLNGEYIIYNDYYGSCSGCDSWEDATDEEVKNMCIGLANDSYIFSSLNDVISYLKVDSNNFSWDDETRDGLYNEIYKNVKYIRNAKIMNIIG